MIGKPVRRNSNAMKDCYFCKGRVIEQKVKVDFRWGHLAQDYWGCTGSCVAAVWRDVLSI